MGRTDNRKAYKAILVKFMSYRDNVQYRKTHEFSKPHLLTITADQVRRYFCKQAYGTETPIKDVDFPTLNRANTLGYWKKAISSFMPNQNMTWNCIRDEGNPTRSQEVLDVIKDIKKYEVRKQGAPSQARRNATDGEMRQVLYYYYYMHKY